MSFQNCISSVELKESCWTGWQPQWPFPFSTSYNESECESETIRVSYPFVFDEGRKVWNQINFTNGLIIKYSHETCNTRYIKWFQGQASWFSEMQWEARATLWRRWASSGQSWERCGIESLSRVLNDVQKFPVLEDTQALFPRTVLESSSHLKRARDVSVCRSLADRICCICINSFLHSPCFLCSQYQ